MTIAVLILCGLSILALAIVAFLAPLLEGPDDPDRKWLKIVFLVSAMTLTVGMSLYGFELYDRVTHQIVEPRT